MRTSPFRGKINIARESVAKAHVDETDIEEAIEETVKLDKARGGRWDRDNRGYCREDSVRRLRKKEILSAREARAARVYGDVYRLSELYRFQSSIGGRVNTLTSAMISAEGRLERFHRAIAIANIHPAAAALADRVFGRDEWPANIREISPVLKMAAQAVLAYFSSLRRR